MTYDQESVAFLLQELFAAEQREEASSMLAHYCQKVQTSPFKESGSPRVQIDLLKLSLGNLDKLAKLIQEAEQDYRNIIMWAEYPLNAQEAEAIMEKLNRWLAENKK